MIKSGSNKLELEGGNTLILYEIIQSPHKSQWYPPNHCLQYNLRYFGYPLIVKPISKR